MGRKRKKRRLASSPNLSVQSVQKVKRSRKRSPNHPILSLEAAIQRAKSLYDHDALHFMPIDLAHRRWEYNAFSSQADQTVAALRAYGLLDVEGVGKKRQARVSDHAERIIRRAPDYDDLIHGAALRPAIHRELWNLYGESGLPSDENIRAYLEWNRPGGTFNKDVVDGVIKRFRETIDFAGLQQGDIIDGGEDEDEEEEDGADGNGEDDEGSRKQMGERGARRRMKPGTDQNVFTLDEGQAVLEWPSDLSEASYKDLKDWLDLTLRKIRRTVKDPSPKEE